MKLFFAEKKYLIPFIFLVSIFPFIVVGKLEKLTGDLYIYWSGESIYPDFFTHYKERFLIVTAVIIIGITIFKLVFDVQARERLDKFKYIFILSGVYVFLMIASALFSNYNKIALYGFVGSNQGLFVQLSYMVVFLAAILLLKDKKDFKIIINSLLVASIAMSVIIIFQKLGMNFLESDAGKWLLSCADEDIRANIKGISMNNPIAGMMFHKDYLGSYYVLVVPIAFGMALLHKGIKNKVFYIVVAVLGTVGLFIGNSRGGIGGVLAGITLITLWVLISYIKKNRKKGLIVLAGVIIVSTIGIFAVSNLHGGLGEIASDVKLIFTSDKSFDINSATELRAIINEEKRAGYTSADGEDKTKTIIFDVEDSMLGIYDENDAPLKYKLEKEERENNRGESKTATVIKIQDERYKNVDIVAANTGEGQVLIVKEGRINFYYELRKNGVELVDSKLMPIDDSEIKSIGFKGRESLFSARGFILSRSLPILKDALFLGYGADTFACVFPQHDLIGKLYSYNTMNKIVDKSHNVLLQMAIDNGVLAMIIFIAIIILCLLKGLKSRFKGVDLISYKGITAFTVIAYMVTGMINDNRISVAPIFFIILGMSAVAINIKFKDEKGK